MPVTNSGRQVLSVACLSLLLALSACTPPEQPPIPSPSPNRPAELAPSGSHSPAVQVTIQLQDESGKPVAGAEVRLESPSRAPQTQRSNAQGQVSFAQIPREADYSVSVSAAGYLSAARRANLIELGKQGQPELQLAVVLTPLRASLRGRVLAAGQPLAGATVSDARISVTTGADGRFHLEQAAAGSLQLTIAKTGFEPLSRPLSLNNGQQQDLGDLALSRRSGPLRLGLDTGHAPLGQSGADALTRYSGLRSTLTTAGFQIQTLTGDLAGQVASLDVLLLLSPSTAFSAAESSEIQAFVQRGGKLILSGEWAGFAGFDAAAANQLLAPFKLQFGLDTLRPASQTVLTARNFLPHGLTAGLSELRLYQAGSVRQTEPTPAALLLARTAPDAFRIATDTGSFGVLAATNHGAGKVIVLGDTSLWSDEDSDGNGRANLDEADNRKLLSQILSW